MRLKNLSAAKRTSWLRHGAPGTACWAHFAIVAIGRRPAGLSVKKKREAGGRVPRVRRPGGEVWYEFPLLLKCEPTSQRVSPTFRPRRLSHCNGCPKKWADSTLCPSMKVCGRRSAFGRMGRLFPGKSMAIATKCKQWMIATPGCRRWWMVVDFIHRYGSCCLSARLKRSTVPIPTIRVCDVDAELADLFEALGS